MARFQIGGDQLVVRLSALEKLGACSRHDPSVPRSAVRDVRVSENPWAELRGIRAPGTGWPGVISLCTRRYEGGRDFAAVYGKNRGVVVDLTDDAPYRRLVVSCNNPEDMVATITQPVAPDTGRSRQ
jgi:hypothetical protein